MGRWPKGLCHSSCERRGKNERWMLYVYVYVVLRSTEEPGSFVLLYHDYILIDKELTPALQRHIAHTAEFLYCTKNIIK